jgi:hypothetical protein
MPTGTGANTQVLTSNGAGGTAWQTIFGASPGLFSQYGTVTIANNTETSLLNTIPVQSIGNLTLAPNSVLTGYSFQLVIGGTFRTNVANTVLTFRLKFNTVVFFTKVITLPLITTPIPWNIQCILTFNGTGMITNFVFRYNPTGLTQSGSFGQTTTTFASGSSNTLDFTAQFTVSNTNNTITSNYAVFSKLY